MFNVRPDRRWFEFHVEPPEDMPGFRLNADGSVGGILPGDSSTAFFGYDLGASPTMPGSTMFNVRPEQDLPGLHNFKPQEGVVPGFRINADGSIGDDAAPTAQRNPDVGSDPFGVFDLPSPSANAFTSVGDGSPPPYLAFARRLHTEFGGAPALNPGAVEPAGMAPSALTSSEPPPSSPPSFARTATGSLPFGAPSGQSLLGQPASFNYAASLLPISGQHSPLSYAGLIPGEGLSMPEVDAASAAAAGVGTGSDGLRSASNHAVDPNLIRVAGGDEDVQIAQQQEAPRPKLRKDPSPGEIVVLPDRSTIPDPESPTGLLMAPNADLSDVAAAGREAGEKLRELSVFPPLALGYLVVTLGLNLGHAGTFDYQRRGNMVIGYTHLQQFEKVSNVNVGLFAQQAGLTLEQVLIIAGEFARHRSSNAKPGEPYGLDPKLRNFITLGYKIGESGMFDRPPMP